MTDPTTIARKWRKRLILAPVTATYFRLAGYQKPAVRTELERISHEQ